ncbi:DUF6777 domain-containing protein [Mycolicibacterium brumae]|uniref:DUF6777 domain-containing protein n=1 Tax=Mycolicibacterium brumae TaxID=85968 RepID=A0A2G5PFK1_9MYCO|nr:DUF6777 domain-containing protein [Mycolicibacterium brumae]MCV7194243.1 hypothetical protein [Mycolicibacterium brumae]PIB77097.1 hypothetical protein CQY22_002220 [Mycolicibacterium brumae]RWA19277.1 hypothetical protein MBRU_17110 [Mycolicibacterium brumae DSM 44177]UWW10430.1 hypothetical protein L2Z93_003560 [Mycolicibacterium brumae]
MTTPVTNPRAPVILAMSALALTVLVLTALVTVVLSYGPEQPEAAPEPEAVLIGVNAVSEPFTSSVLSTAVLLSEPAQAKAAELRQQLPVSPRRGVRPASGRQPGLYGVGAVAPCDVVALANDLDANPGTATPWGLALGLTPEQLPFYLNTLTPVVLLNDSWVTLHTPSGPEQAVLAAGTAVLVDALGVPRTHCASGSPLSPPVDADLGGYRLTGTTWDYFARTEVVVVKYAAEDHAGPVTEFTLLNIDDGQQVTRPVGRSIDLGGETKPLPDPAVMNIAFQPR